MHSRNLGCADGFLKATGCEYSSRKYGLSVDTVQVWRAAVAYSRHVSHVLSVRTETATSTSSLGLLPSPTILLFVSFLYNTFTLFAFTCYLMGRAGRRRSIRPSSPPESSDIELLDNRGGSDANNRGQEGEENHNASYARRKCIVHSHA